jgi:hypothetical protein
MSGLMKQKIALKDKQKLMKQINGKFNCIGSADEIEDLRHLAQASLGYFLVRFQSFQLPSAQSESPFAPKSRVSFKVRMYSTVKKIFHFSYFDPV